MFTAFNLSYQERKKISLKNYSVARDPQILVPTESDLGHLELFLPTTIARQPRRHQPKMAAERKERTGLAVGLNKGHV
jgi:hypothetical protein